MTDIPDVLVSDLELEALLATGRYGMYWYNICVRLASQHSLRSVDHVFWWSLRFELQDPATVHAWATDPDRALRDWVEYLSHKLDRVAP